MANHFQAVGFSVNDSEQWTEVVNRTAALGEETAFPDGALFRWTQEGGEEIVILVDDERNFRGGAPHFSGATRAQVALVGALPDAEAYWEGAFYAWMNPPEDDLQSGDYPLVFDVADFWVVKDQLTLPQRATVQIAAFAHEIEFFASEIEYSNAQTGDTQYAPDFFIPSGLFTGESGGAPQPYALFAGTIVQYQQRINSATKQVFHHFEVQTFGGVFDVVAEDELVTQAAQTPQIGGLLKGVFWMSGSVQEEG